MYGMKMRVRVGVLAQEEEERGLVWEAKTT